MACDTSVYEPRYEKTNILDFDLVRHKSGCTATEDGQRLEISDLESMGIVLCSETKGADQLRGYREADLRLCFRTCKSRFSHNEAHMIFIANRQNSSLELFRYIVDEFEHAFLSKM